MRHPECRIFYAESQQCRIAGPVPEILLQRLYGSGCAARFATRSERMDAVIESGFQGKYPSDQKIP